MHESEKWKWSRSVVSDSLQPHGLQPTRLLHPWDSPGKSTGVGCHCLLLLSFLSTIGWKTCSFPTELSWHPCQESFGHRRMGLVLNSQFYCIDLYIYPNDVGHLFMCVYLPSVNLVFIYLFIYYLLGCVRSLCPAGSFVAVHGSLVAPCRLQQLQHTG